MKKKIMVALLCTAMSAALFTGCGASDNGSANNSSSNESSSKSTSSVSDASDSNGDVTSYKIGVSIMELTAYTWYQGVIDGCKDWLEDNGEKYGVDFEYDFEDSSSDVQKMLTNVENMISAGCDGIILFPADSSSAIPTMKEAVSNGIPFVIGDYEQDAKSDSDKVWSTFVGHDMKALGEKAGEVAVEYLDTLGKDDPVCVFITRPTSGEVSSDRFEGFSETVLAAYPNATIIEEGDTGAGNRDSAQTLMENILQREATVDVVCGHNDAETVGAYYAAVAQGRDEIKFIGIAGDIDVLGWIASGNEMWLGEVLQDPVVLGYQAADAMYHTLKGEEIEEYYDLPEPEAITADNISEYDWESWGWLG